MTADLQDDSVQPSAAGLLTLEATRAGDNLLLNRERFTPYSLACRSI